MRVMAQDLNQTVTTVRKEWGWVLAVGIVLIALGAAAIVFESKATVASVVALGAIICIGGIFQLIAAFEARGAGHVILYLLMGVLELVVGFVLIEDPGAGAVSLTLVLAVYFMFGGIYRAIFALWMQFPGYGWYVLSGIVSVALGVMLLAQMPSASTWFLGFAVGVNFIIYGIAWSAFAFKLKPAAQ